MADENKKNEPKIKSITKAISILQTLKQVEEAGVTEISVRSGLPKSTVHRYLAALKQNELVVMEEKKYRLSLSLLDYGISVRNMYAKSELFKQKTAELASKTSERAQYIVQEQQQGIHLYSVSGDRGIDADIHPGKTVPLHATAAGKSILAFKPKDWIKGFVRHHGLPKYTENTITDEDRLMNELDEIRESKIAYNRGERIDGFLSVGSPVFQNDTVYGAFSVTGIKSRMGGNRAEEEIPKIMLEQVEEIEMRLKYGEP